jgi:FAD/FMN-containing dehydrogenase
LACDALVAAEVITAEGKLVRASADENPDLFWGLRGGGGNFGVVVDFEFAAHPLGPIVMAVGVMYPAAEAPELMRRWRDWATDAPDEITTRAMFWSMPAAPALPPAVHNRDVFIIAALYAGDANEGERALNPVRTFSTPLADLSGQVPYRMFQAGFDPLVAGLHSYWKSTYLPELSDQALDLICERGLNRPDPKTLIHVPLMGGATSRVGAEDTAFGDRSAPWMLSVDGNWTDEANAETVKTWVRSFIDDAEKHLGGGGAYLNFSGVDPTDAGQVRAQFGNNLERLIAVKSKYDPTNLFRINNNIKPE